MKIRWLHLNMLLAACLMIPSSSVVLCAQQSGMVRVVFADHTCRTAGLDLCIQEHSCPSENCHFHPEECCRDVPLSMGPTLIVNSKSESSSVAPFRTVLLAPVDFRCSDLGYSSTDCCSIHPLLSSTILLI